MEKTVFVNDDMNKAKQEEVKSHIIYDGMNTGNMPGTLNGAQTDLGSVSELDMLYRELGKAYYEGGFEDPLPELLPLFDKITSVRNMSVKEPVKQTPQQSVKEDVEPSVQEGITPAIKFCGSCGKQLNAEAKFCGACGAKQL